VNGEHNARTSNLGEFTILFGEQLGKVEWSLNVGLKLGPYLLNPLLKQRLQRAKLSCIQNKDINLDSLGRQISPESRDVSRIGNVAAVSNELSGGLHVLYCFNEFFYGMF